MESPQRDLRIGVVLNGRYRVTELLGEGGMGLVYRGERLQLGRPVAIKFLHSPYAKSPKYMARFEREARAMSKLSHPYVVSVIDFGVHDEPYIVMDFVTGETLRDLLDREPITPSRAIQLTRQILAGLAHAHSQGVIHRDIKPGNIMIGEATGVGDHVRIFDFGLAKLHDPTNESEQSMATVIGTPAYMAPEQTRAEPIDARADLYATGVLLFEMLTGDKPFVGEDAYAVIRLQREAPPPRLRERVPELSVELEQVVARALEKDRGQRFQTAAEFASALEAVPEAAGRAWPAEGGFPSEGTGSQRALPKTPPAPPATPLPGSEAAARARRRALLWLGVLAVVGGFAYVSTRSGSSAPPEGAVERIVRRALPRATTPAPEPVMAVDAAIATMQDAEVATALVEVAPGADAGEDELSEAELAAADQALSDPAEREATTDAGVHPEVYTISDVHALIDAREYDAAVEGLRYLRKKTPYNPYLPYLLGELYFERHWWADGLAKYREAIELSDGYRRRTSIQKNAVRALGADSTYARARQLLVRDVGKVALPVLRQAAQSDPSPVVRKRARLIAQQIAR